MKIFHFSPFSLYVVTIQFVSTFSSEGFFVYERCNQKEIFCIGVAEDSATYYMEDESQCLYNRNCDLIVQAEKRGDAIYWSLIVKSVKNHRIVVDVSFYRENQDRQYSRAKPFELNDILMKLQDDHRTDPESGLLYKNCSVGFISKDNDGHSDEIIIEDDGSGSIRTFKPKESVYKEVIDEDSKEEYNLCQFESGSELRYKSIPQVNLLDYVYFIVRHNEYEFSKVATSNFTHKYEKAKERNILNEPLKVRLWCREPFSGNPEGLLHILLKILLWTFVIILIAVFGTAIYLYWKEKHGHLHENNKLDEQLNEKNLSTSNSDKSEFTVKVRSKSIIG